MKTKVCALCKIESDVMYRVKINKSKMWIFVCESCCKLHKTSEGYVYGGTWKGYRH